MRVHTYVIVVDSGAAPNYDKPFTTLAVCKPRIRRKAGIGELVLAFAGQKVNPYEPHTVVWAGVVTEKLSFAEYWNDTRFAGKKPDRALTPDNFYRPTKGDGLLWVENPVHELRAVGARHQRAIRSGLQPLVALRRQRPATTDRLRSSHDPRPSRRTRGRSQRRPVERPSRLA